MPAFIFKRIIILLIIAILAVQVSVQTKTSTQLSRINCKLIVINHTNDFITIAHGVGVMKPGIKKLLPVFFTAKIPANQQGVITVHEVPVNLPAKSIVPVNLQFKVQHKWLPLSFKVNENCKFSLLSSIHNNNNIIFTLQETVIKFGNK